MRYGSLTSNSSNGGQDRETASWKPVWATQKDTIVDMKAKPIECGEEESQKINGKSENKPMHLQSARFVVALVSLFSFFK